jgi:hypothetical protein
MKYLITNTKDNYELELPTLEDVAKFFHYNNPSSVKRNIGKEIVQGKRKGWIIEQINESNAGVYYLENNLNYLNYKEEKKEEKEEQQTLSIFDLDKIIVNNFKINKKNLLNDYLDDNKLNDHFLYKNLNDMIIQKKKFLKNLETNGLFINLNNLSEIDEQNILKIYTKMLRKKIENIFGSKTFSANILGLVNFYIDENYNEEKKILDVKFINIFEEIQKYLQKNN